MTMDAAAESDAAVVRSLVPARMDRLPWSAFHWRVIIALGITWVLDGIEITLASSIGNLLRSRHTLALSAEEVGLAGSIYLIGEIVGALYFGYLADKLGRRKLFIVTLALYLLANGLTALSFSRWYFFLTRFGSGMGIGGEYAAIHSAIDELTPSKYRGRVDVAVAGTYWGGAILAAGAQLLLLNPALVPINLGWRLGLLLGPLIGLSILPLRKYIPESPRWQLTHGQAEEAERTVDAIEAQLRKKGIELPEVDPADAIVIKERDPLTYKEIARVLFDKYRSRSFLAFSLLGTQSFLYNAIFFSYALILGEFYGVSNKDIPLFLFPFFIGNLLGPLLIGRYFDTIGRRRMIAGTYCTSALLLGLSGWLFQHGLLTAQTQTILWCSIFFIASAAASSAYLTVSEIFPVEMRAQAISLFFALAQLVGAGGAYVFDAIVGTKDRNVMAYGYTGAAVIMFLGGLIAYRFGVDAEGKSLESVAPPVAAEGAEVQVAIGA